MAKRQKRLESIRRNPRQVRFSDLKTVLEGVGFRGRPGQGDHWVFGHELLRYHITIDPRQPFLLAVYVKNALRAIDEVLEKTEVSEHDDE